MPTKLPYGPTAPPKIPAGTAFQALCLLRNNEALVRMHRAHFGIALNLAGISAVAARIVVSKIQAEIFLYVVGAFAAAVLNRFWFPVVERNNDRLGFWNGKMEQTERVVGIEGGIAIFTALEYQRLRAASDISA